MARALKKLNARQVETLNREGRHSDGGGLYLVVGPGASRRWAFLFPLARQAQGNGPRLGCLGFPGGRTREGQRRRAEPLPWSKPN